MQTIITVDAVKLICPCIASVVRARTKRSLLSTTKLKHTYIHHDHNLYYTTRMVHCIGNSRVSPIDTFSTTRNRIKLVVATAPIGTRNSSYSTTTTTTTTTSIVTTSTDTDSTNNNAILHYKWIYPINTAAAASTSSTVKHFTNDENVNNTDKVLFVFLHGLFGQGKNLTTMAQHIVNNHNDTYQQESQGSRKSSAPAITTLGVLIDLYGHGQSSSLSSLSINSSSTNGTTTGIQDVLSNTLYKTIRHCLFSDLQIQQDPQNLPKIIIVGHSLGGRVALHYTVTQQQLACVRKDGSSARVDEDIVLLPHHIWLLDTVPNKPDKTVIQVLDAIVTTIPIYHHTIRNVVPGNGSDNNTTGFRTRHNIRQMIQSYKRPITSMDSNKIPDSIVDWISSQWLLKEQRFMFDVPIIQLIVNDLLNENYSDRNSTDVESNDVRSKRLSFWEQIKMILQNRQPGIESKNEHHAPAVQIHIVQAEKNVAGWDDPVTKETLQSIVQQYPKSIYHYILPNSGHWVHVDNLPGLLQFFQQVYDGTDRKEKLYKWRKT